MKQFKLVVTFFFGTLLLSSAASADSSPYKNGVMPIGVTTPYNWTGIYGGLNIGAVKNTMNITDNQAVSFDATLQQSYNPQFTGGLQVGYRYQLDPTKTSGVFGVELSANFSDANDNKQYGSPFALYQIDANTTLRDVCLLQLIGGIAADRTLLFLAGGLSWVNIAGSVTNLSGAPFFNSYNVNKKAMGTSVGGGVEYAVNEKISLRLKVDVITPNVYTVTDNTNDHFQISNNIVQAAFGLNYKFG